MKTTGTIDFDSLRRIAHDNRKKILDMVYSGGSGHIGGALSAVDVITYLGECVIDMTAGRGISFSCPKDMPYRLSMRNSII